MIALYSNLYDSHNQPYDSDITSLASQAKIIIVKERTVSSDNFWFTNGGEVYMGFASNFESAIDEAEQRFFDDIVKRNHVYFKGTVEEAAEWAHREYSEYGYWGEH